MAFNNWPYTNFQDLNLGWILNTYKNALNKALDALGKANAVEAEVGTYTDQINAATLTANQASATANQAMELANTANELLYIFDHGESKAQNFVKYVEGATVFVSATDIFTAVAGDHKLPVFMDRNNYIYEMAGFETNPDNPLEVTRFRFIRDGGDRQYIVWIDRSANITYTTAYSGVGTLNVNFTSLQSTGQTSCDKTYAEVRQAYNSGMTVRCHVVDEIHHVEYYAYDCEFIENDETGDYFRWCSPYVSAISGFYKPFLREDELCNIGTATISGGGSADAVLYTAQTLTSAQKTQARSNIGAGKSTVTVSNSVMTIVDADTGSQTAYPIGGGGSYSPYTIPVTLSGGVYSTTATAMDVYEHILDCRIEFNGVYYYQIGATLSGTFGDVYLASANPAASGKYDVDIFQVHLPGNSNLCTVTKYEKDIKLLPDTTNASAADFLMLDSNKNPAWVAVPNAANVSFGGV